jgi:hypothetical protein
MQELRPMGAAEQRRFMEAAYPRASRAGSRAFERWPGGERDDASAESVAKLWATWVFSLETSKDSFGLAGPSIHRAILRVRYDRGRSTSAKAERRPLQLPLDTLVQASASSTAQIGPGRSDEVGG